MNLFYHPDLSQQFELSEAEAHHALKVFRYNQGDLIHVTDGKGTIASARIQRVTKSSCFCELIDQHKYPKRNYNIHLAIAPTKNSERMEWLVEKCVEIGVDQISFITCQHSERKKVNLHRIQKVAISAMKQSQQPWLPPIHNDIRFGQILTGKAAFKAIAYVDDSNPIHLMRLAPVAADYLVLVGPEGDFSKEELTAAMEAGFQKVSLGTNRLRTETAGLMTCCFLVGINS